MADTQTQLDKLIDATQIIHDVANEDETSVVATESGNVVSVSKAMYDISSTNPRGAWVTGATYLLKDLVEESGDIYIVTLPHTSGVFATDLADGKIAIFQNRYFDNNVDKVLSNDTGVTPGEAHIGKEYQDYQGYGQTASGDIGIGAYATGDQYYAFFAEGIISFGYAAKGPQSYGGAAEDTQYYGYYAVASQLYGYSATADQEYGSFASGGIYLGQNAEGAIEIGSDEGSHATKKLISGTKEATFEQIIEPWGAWQTIAYTGGAVVPSDSDYRQSLVCRKSSDGKNVQISGAFSRPSGTNYIGVIPSGYRPLNKINVTGDKYDATDYTPCQITILADGNIIIGNDNGKDISIEAIFPLD